MGPWKQARTGGVACPYIPPALLPCIVALKPNSRRNERSHHCAYRRRRLRDLRSLGKKTPAKKGGESKVGETTNKMGRAMVCRPPCECRLQLGARCRNRSGGRGGQRTSSVHEKYSTRNLSKVIRLFKWPLLAPSFALRCPGLMIKLTGRWQRSWFERHLYVGDLASPS